MRVFVASLLISVVAVVSAFAIAGDLNVGGKWKINADAGGQEVDITMELTHEGEKIKGTVSTPFGDGTFDDGKLDGKKLIGTINMMMQGQDLSLDFSGTIDGDSISGAIMGEGIPEVTFTGTKEKAEKDSN